MVNVTEEAILVKAGWADGGYTFPSSAKKNEVVAWSAKVKNVGTSSGTIYFAITNRTGNPSTITIVFLNQTFDVPTGNKLIMNGEVAAGQILGGASGIAGTVKFLSAGHFYLDVAGGHLEAGQWIDDVTAVVDG